MTAKLLVIDNYDSFTFNLVQMFRSYDLGISVFRADALSVADVVRQQPDYILVSPGLKRQHVDYDVVHVNSEFAAQASDHDPQIVRIKP